MHSLLAPGTRAVAAKPSAVTARQPCARDQERKSSASSLRMDPHGRSGRRKPTKPRSISRALILCGAKTSDDGSSPDERCPDPFGAALGPGEGGGLHAAAPLAGPREAGPSSAPGPAPASEAARLSAAGSNRGKGCRRAFFLKVRPGARGPEGPALGFRCPEGGRVLILSAGGRRARPAGTVTGHVSSPSGSGEVRQDAVPAAGN